MCAMKLLLLGFSLELVELSLLATAGWWDGLSVVLSGKVHEVSLVAEL